MPVTATSSAELLPSATPVPSVTPAPQVSGETVDVSPGHYIDDRSSAVSVLASLFNAVNRKEYLRAYAYWEPQGQISGTSFSAFEAGYATTESVELQVGEVTMGAAAGNLYYAVPVSVSARSGSSQVERYVGCYELHLSQPAVQGVPPFQGMGIRKGVLKLAPSGQDASALLADACGSAGIETGQPLPAEPAYAPDDISARRYLDDRSDALQVLRSYFNAVNRAEYVRAYSYWKSDAAAALLPAYEQFAAGYAETAAVSLAAGQTQADAGAGQYYYTLPVALLVTTTTGVEQTFAGCYQLHASNPAFQATPPFAPLNIISATIRQVENSTDIASLTSQACQ